jgi:hypothetical protein
MPRQATRVLKATVVVSIENNKPFLSLCVCACVCVCVHLINFVLIVDNQQGGRTVDVMIDCIHEDANHDEDEDDNDEDEDEDDDNDDLDRWNGAHG